MFQKNFLTILIVSILIPFQIGFSQIVEKNFKGQPQRPGKRQQIHAPRVAKKKIQTVYPNSTLSGTLPADVHRVRMSHNYLFSAGGYSPTGQWESTGIAVDVGASGLIFDIGLQENLTVAIGVPYVYSNHASFNGSIFDRSSIYSYYYNKYLDDFIEGLRATGNCISYAACKEQIQNGESLSFDNVVRVSSTNEEINIPANKPLKEVLHDLIVNGGKQSEGTTGLGDLQVGLRYQFLRANSRVPFSAAFTGGVRVPTGKLSRVPKSQRAIGRGIFELNGALSADYEFMKGAAISSSYSLEFAPLATERYRQGVIDNSKLVKGNCPEVSGNVKDPKCKNLGEKSTYDRQGLHQIGLFQASYSMGNVWYMLKMLGLNLGIQYERDSQEVIDGDFQPRFSQTSLYGGLTVSGLVLNPMVPFALDINYLTPIAGNSQFAALSQVSVTLQSFIKF